MILPISYRPKITQQDVARGVISRYFTQYVSSRIVVEIDENQYNFFKVNPYYTTVKLPWVLVGNLYTTPSMPSVEEQNKRIVQYYSKTLPALPRYVKNFMEYVQPIINTRPTPTIVEEVSSVQEVEEDTPSIATTITTVPTTLTYSYVIGGTVPTSQSVAITSNGSLSGIFITSASSWVSASLGSSTAPTTLQILPIVTGLYSGSYTSTVTVNTIQTGVTATSIGITLNVTNNPDVLFVYEPGMSLSSATFNRPTSASFNELVP